MNAPTMPRFRSGWHSTKLHLALITMATVTAVFVAMHMPEHSFDTYCLTLVTGAGIFSGTRVMESFAARPQAKPGVTNVVLPEQP